MAPNQLEALLGRAREWAAHDIDPVTQAEAERLATQAEAGDEAAAQELAEAFGERLAFGTAGLRGRLGAGPSRMNRVVVSQTSAGFAAFLLARAARGETSNPPSIVIGYDARVNSDVFARDTAEIMAGAGVQVTLFPTHGPTPLVAFAVRHLGVSAGVMVTASHNPPRDNGYKVYLGDADAGSQIVAPADSEIAARIDAAAATPISQLPRSSTYAYATPDIAAAYVTKTAASLLAGFPVTQDGRTLNEEVPVKVVYTAMHGVGAELSERVILASGLPLPIPVPEQHVPDGNFPTVDFPNPEEPGALDLAFRTAREVNAELVIAHDPDADRLAIALPDAAEESGYRA
ncbi:MAG: phospho-sugar mutase, partial [Leucobacter sp.]|nr:phospho-sugar mutase [Leucobacter sp.]